MYRAPNTPKGSANDVSIRSACMHQQAMPPTQKISQECGSFGVRMYAMRLRL